MLRRRTLPPVVLLCLVAWHIHPAHCETPQFPLRTDWVGGEILQPPGEVGPDVIPEQLYGSWRVSLCVKPGLHRGHAWIRYQNINTREVHTIGRFQKHVRPTRRRTSREVLYPRTTQSGLHWDYDWRFEHEVRQGKYLIDSVIVRDPYVYGLHDPHGHGVIRANCITYARDAWQYYSGYYIDLPAIHTPEGFLKKIAAQSARDGFASPHRARLLPRDGENTAQFSLRRLPPVE